MTAAFPCLVQRANQKQYLNLGGMAVMTPVVKTKARASLSSVTLVQFPMDLLHSPDGL